MNRPPWLVRITMKRPEVLLILHALLIQLRQRGECTAEDAHNIPVTHPNTRGAAMKYLGNFGCKKNPIPIQGTTKQSHGHWLHKWIVYDSAALEQGFMMIREAVTGLEPDNDGNLMLL